MTVKPPTWWSGRTILALVIPAVAGITAGCAPTGTPGVTHRPARVVPVAMRYRLHAGPSDGATDRLVADFAAIRALGFDTILVDSVDDERRSTVLAAARAAELACILECRATNRYIRSGQLPPDVDTIEDLVRDRLDTTEVSSPLSMHRLLDAPAPSMMERLREVQAALARHDPGRSTFVLVDGAQPIHTDRIGSCTLAMDADALGMRTPLEPTAVQLAADREDPVDDVSLAGGHRRVVVIPSAASPDRPHGPSVEAWRLIYHRGLAAGLTDGVLFSAYRGSTRDRPGVRGAARELPLARRAALKALTQRVARWSALLTGSQVLPGDGLRFATSAASAVPFIKGQRRFLLIYNPKVDQFVRDTVHVPRQVAGARLRRGVDVDSLERYPARPARLSFAVHLKPADAMLLELVSAR